jgi:uncharacterized protein YkwD
MYHRARSLCRHALIGLLLAAMAASTTIGPAAVSASSSTPSSSTSTPTSPTARTVEGYLISWVNRDRQARGLRPLRLWTPLRNVATMRAETLASLGTLSHTAAGNLSSQLTSAGVPYYTWGEDLGWSSYPWGYDVAKSLYGMWKRSSSHWALLMSTRFNYFGVGLAYRWSAHATYASIVFTESPDHTPPSARIVDRARSGTTVWFRWRGYDPRLQTHTAGVRNFDVMVKTGSGSWQLIRSGTTSTSISLYSRPHGRYTYLSVRARDWRGNVGRWSAAVGIYVP